MAVLALKLLVTGMRICQIVKNLQKKSDGSFGFEIVGDWDEDL